jgi:N-acetylglucosamine-6-sulfatase
MRARPACVRYLRYLLIATALGASAIVLAGAGPAGHDPAAAGPSRPNIVLILSDDERWDSNRRMANVQRLLAARGVTFTNAFVTTSECCPSRASILTGQYSRHTGVVQNYGPRSYPAFRERSTVPVWLLRAGYQTALVGKYLNDYPVYGRHRIPPGWSGWWAIDSRPEQRYYDYTLNENGRLVRYGVAPTDYSTMVLGRKAVGFLARAREPFFLYFAPIAPHLPAIPAPRDLAAPLELPRPRPDFEERDLSDKPWSGTHRRVLAPHAVGFLDRDIEGRQLQTLRALDRQVAAIVRALRKRGLLDRTVVLYASDNGFLWGEHRLGGKIWPYEESIRVPLIVRVPWQSAWGRRDAHMVLNIDLASTIAELAGVEPGIRQDGRSLVSLLRGESPRWRREFVIEYLGESQLSLGGPPPFSALRTRRWLYVEYLNGWRELYDLRRDPYELRNRAGDPALAKTSSRLARRLHALAAR